MRRLFLSPSVYVAVVLTSVFAIWAARSGFPGNATAAEPDGRTKATPKAVEEGCLELMEYVFDEPFHRLKEALAAEPRDKAAWKTIKSDSLILAECSNLLLLRNPYDEELWDETSVACRQDGGEIYAAAKKKDLAAATAAFRSMVINCNRCHDEYGGEEMEP